jgi:hypothetical protein
MVLEMPWKRHIRMASGLPEHEPDPPDAWVRYSRPHVLALRRKACGQ